MNRYMCRACWSERDPAAHYCENCGATRDRAIYVTCHEHLWQLMGMATLTARLAALSQRIDAELQGMGQR